MAKVQNYHKESRHFPEFVLQMKHLTKRDFLNSLMQSLGFVPYFMDINTVIFFDDLQCLLLWRPVHGRCSNAFTSYIEKYTG